MGLACATLALNQNDIRRGIDDAVEKGLSQWGNLAFEHGKKMLQSYILYIFRACNTEAVLSPPPHKELWGGDGEFSVDGAAAL